MCSGFFQHYGNEICVKDYADLLAKFSEVDCSVPPRTEGRTSEHRERFCLKFYLLILGKHNLLTFPLTILKCEAPDFLITDGTGQTTGVEHTDGTREEYQRALNMLAKSEEGTFLELDLFKTTGGPLSKNQIKATLRRPDSALVGKGWRGDEVERVWSTIITSTVLLKTHDLNKAHYASADAYELLIYSNTHLVGLHVVPALQMLKQKIKSLSEKANYTKRFDRISVIHGEILFFDVGKSDKRLPQII